MSPRRIILIGAARSGTRLVRDSLAAAADVGAVPYDINFVWRYRNESAPDDILQPEWASSAARCFITRYIDRYAKNDTVLEKTVSNTLRLPFVREILPDAAVIHLVRDGVDVIESTRNQWLARADRSYLLRKVRHFPPRLIPGYGRKYASRVLNPRRRREEPVSSWGVRYPGLDADLQQDGLLTVCARQWRQSVDCATAALATMDNNRVEVRYEDLVADPRTVLERLINGLGLTSSPSTLDAVASNIRPTNVGKGARRLSPAEISVIGREADETLDHLGYERAGARIQESEK